MGSRQISGNRASLRFLEKPLVKNALWMLGGQSARLIIQGLYFFIIARDLGPKDYGAFIAAASFVAILAPFSSLGFGHIMVQNVSRDKSVFAVSWGQTMMMTAFSGSIFLLLILALCRYALPLSIPISIVFLIGVADLFFNKLIGVSGQAFQALEFLKETALLNILLSLWRCNGAVLLFLLVPGSGAQVWALVYCLTTAVAALFAVVLVHLEIDTPAFTFRGLFSKAKEGIYFSFSLASQNIYNDIDKIMLARLSTLQATGIYAAAYKIIDVAFIPVRSILYACYPRFFKHGMVGIRDGLSFAKRMIRVALPYSAYAGVILFFTAPLIPYILGNEYLYTVEALRWLAPLPFLKTLHYFAADTLSGAGHQAVRTLSQILVALFNVTINLWLIPAYSWRGAAWASLAADAFLVVSLWAAIVFFSFREPRARLLPELKD